MSEFLKDFENTIIKIVEMQLESPPSIILEVIQTALRFVVLGMGIAVIALFIQTIIALFNKKTRLHSIPLGISFALLLGAVLWVFTPFSASVPGEIETGTLQEIVYKTNLQIEEENAQLALEQQAQQEATAEQTATEGEQEVQTTEETLPEDTAADFGTNENDDENSEESENELQRTVNSQNTFTSEQLSAIEEILSQTQCKRTLLRKLPQENGQNISITLDDGTKWQVMLLQNNGYVYKTETTSFIHVIEEYDAFYNELLAALS